MAGLPFGVKGRGGGGYPGGGHGGSEGGGGGGGGQSYADPAAADVTFSTSTRTGDGLIVLTWEGLGGTPGPGVEARLSSLEAAVRDAGARLLATQVQRAANLAAAERVPEACRVLRRILHAVQLAARAEQLTDLQAAQFTADASDIRRLLGCS